MKSYNLSGRTVWIGKHQTLGYVIFDPKAQKSSDLTNAWIWVDAICYYLYLSRDVSRAKMIAMPSASPELEWENSEYSICFSNYSTGACIPIDLWDVDLIEDQNESPESTTELDDTEYLRDAAAHHEEMYGDAEDYSRAHDNGWFYSDHD